ncbi:MAG: arabinogalactan endo-1,4-beta-galactosidase [Muribaculaceae bacterium]|nr:arabinogalactan endo-1,4-beta-galactosidase [Muribaculaceae bacterium]
MNKILAFYVTFICMLGLVACSSEQPEATIEEGDVTATKSENNQPTYTSVEFSLVKGADVSWLTEMEAQGIRFYNDNGTEQDCLHILQSKGINTIRLRVWVNPPNNYCGLQDVLVKAKRAQQLGMDLMIDFHYSDDWADPSKQTIPAAWQGMNLNELCQAVSAHTTDFLTALKNEGVTVKWVQVGNETGNGMLWPYGQADKNPAGYASLVNSGYDAVKGVYPDAKVIIHLQNGQDQSLFTWLFDILKNNGARYDVIGMSLYPEPINYTAMLNSCRANMVSCISRYDKDVILCEVGMGNSYVNECADFLRGCLNLANSIADNRFLGVLYWEPEVYNDWNGYKKGAFTSQGRPGKQLDPFADKDSSLPTITMD